MKAKYKLILGRRKNEKQKLQVENLIGQNKKLVDVVVALQEELVNLPIYIGQTTIEIQSMRNSSQ